MITGTEDRRYETRWKFAKTDMSLLNSSSWYLSWSQPFKPSWCWALNSQLIPPRCALDLSTYKIEEATHTTWVWRWLPGTSTTAPIFVYSQPVFILTLLPLKSELLTGKIQSELCPHGIYTCSSQHVALAFPLKMSCYTFSIIRILECLM